MDNVAAKTFLFQRLSIAIQQGNAASIWGTLPGIEMLDEVELLSNVLDS